MKKLLVMTGMVTLLACKDKKDNPQPSDEWTLSTFAGNGEFLHKDGPANQASFVLPMGMWADAQGTFYLCDQHRIRKITPDGTVGTIAGSGVRGAENGTANTASFNYPAAMVKDAAGNLYVTDQRNNLIRKISADGIVSTFAGTGSEGHQDGAHDVAEFSLPYGITIDAAAQNLYVTDYSGHRVRKINIATRMVSTYAGNGTNISTNGDKATAGIPWPGGITMDAQGNLYLVEMGAGRVRLIKANGEVTTIGSFNGTNEEPGVLTLDDAGNAYVVYKGINAIRQIQANGVVKLLFGENRGGEKPILITSFSSPEGIVVSKNAQGRTVFYIADTDNHKIMRISRK